MEEQALGNELGSRRNNEGATSSSNSQRHTALREPSRDRARQFFAVDGNGGLCAHDACEGVFEKEREAFLRIVEASESIANHQDLQLWLQGEVQRFIRHEVLISAHGYFDTWQLKLDVISSLPGVRTQLLAKCDIDGILKALFERWVDNEREPFVLASLQGLAQGNAKCKCPLHTILREAKSVLVHGVRDERGDSDTLYIALHCGSIAKGCMSGCFRGSPCFLIDSLVARIDIASRKVASLPSGKTIPTVLRNGGPSCLSERERELMNWICMGKTNSEIAMILGISRFTVKNHMQRIFQKIGVKNRVHAVTFYREQVAKLANGQRG